MGCRCGERLLGHCFYVCLIFLFLHGWEYHVSAAKPPIISAWFCSFTSLSTTADHIPVHQIIYLWNILPSPNIIIPCIISIIYTPHHQCVNFFIYLPLHHSRSYSSSSDSISIDYTTTPQHHNTLYQINYLYPPSSVPSFFHLPPSQPK